MIKFNRLASLFRTQAADDPLEQDLEAFEQQVAGAANDYRGTILARAAERCVEAGDDARAAAYFGRAIDSYLEFGYYDVAASMCRRVLELYPNAVRTRCTLAFLSLGSGLPHLPFHDLMADARREIGGYVQAAIRAEREDLAAERLFLMAGVTDPPALREMIGEFLLDLGAAEKADAVYGSVNAERNRLVEPSTEDQRVRWARVLRMSIVSPEPAPAPLEPDPV